MRFVQQAAAILATKYSMSLEGTEEFVAGLLYGMVQKDDLPQIQNCLTNAESLEVEITNAVSDISKGDFQDVLKAVQEIGQIIKELPTDLDECKDIQDDITKVEAWAAVFANPVKLAETLTKNLLANWKKVSADVTTVESDWNAAKYYEAGEDVADMLILSVGPISESQNEKEQIDWALLQDHLTANLFLFWVKRDHQIVLKYNNAFILGSKISKHFQ